MKIIIKATNTKLSPSVNEYIEEKIGGLDKFLKGFDSELIEARVDVGKIKQGQRQGEIFRAEVNLNISGHLIRAEETEDSLMAAIDLVKDRLSREIKRYKDKKMTKFIRGARSWKKLWRIHSLARFRSPKAKKIIRRK